MLIPEGEGTLPLEEEEEEQRRRRNFSHERREAIRTSRSSGVLPSEVLTKIFKNSLMGVQKRGRCVLCLPLFPPSSHERRDGRWPGDAGEGTDGEHLKF